MMDTEEPKEDLEDGELTSDEEESAVLGAVNLEEPSIEALQTVDYVLNERPIAWATKLRKQTGGSSTADPSSHQYEPPVRPSRPEPPLFVDDDESGEGSSSSEDSDEEGPGGKKIKRMGDPISTSSNFKASSSKSEQGYSWSSTNPFDPATGPSSDGNDAFKNQATVFQQKRKTNNIWSSVLQDEEVSNIFGKVQVQEGNPWDVMIDRGPESFSIKYDKRPPLRRRSDSSSISSGGLTDNELEFLKGKRDEEPESSTAKVEDPEEEDYKLPTKFGTRHLKRRRNPQSRSRKQMKKKMVRRMKRMTPELLGKYMAKKLTEPKDVLLIRAVTLLGKEPCISLFLKTMKIERRGGLLIKNNERRRTPGGVFLYLLRGDRRFSRSMVDRIFNEERHSQSKKKKKAGSRKRLRHKAKLEVLVAASEADAASAEQAPENCEEAADAVSQECMDEDSDIGSLPDPNESEVDSDEFYRVHDTQNLASTSNIVDTSRGLVSYDPDEDCLNIHCDSSDIVYK